jgi:hypothetical protein
VEFAQSDEAEIREIRIPVRIARDKLGETGEMFIDNESRPDQPFAHKTQNELSAAQVKCRLRQRRLAGQKWFADSLGHFERPGVIAAMRPPKATRKPVSAMAFKKKAWVQLLLRRTQDVADMPQACGGRG